MKRLKEETETGYVIHLDGPILADGRTLCGYAFEGNPGDDDAPPVTVVERGKINCMACLNIIWHCQDVPKRLLAPPDARKIRYVQR